MSTNVKAKGKSKVKVGLIGAGRIGQLHAEHLRQRLPEAELLVVADASVEAAECCAAKWGIPAVVPDYRAVLDHPGVEAVVVCSPTDTHSDIIEAAALAGRHIFCEKPLDVDLARIDRVLESVRRAGVLLQVGFNRRFDPEFARVRRAVVDGEIGTPHQVHIVSRDPSPPPIEYVRRSGGLFLDMTIHDFDMAAFLLGEEVNEVFAMGGVRVDPAIGSAGDLDTAVVLLRSGSGAMAVIENCRQAVYGYDQRVEVFGSAGAIRVDNRHSNSALISGAQSVRRDLPLRFFMDRYVESYLIEMRAFLEAVQTGGDSPVSGAEGRHAVAMALAAARSWQEHRPVSLAEFDARA
jgi:myo-inositol 2-dehydrogenase/D-chiro-inositol 1-dehydrogenase